jgi:ATP-binding cassette, subfamily G (WHITE), member 2, SNQ2
VYTGYLVPYNAQHVYFRWLTWINWVQYGFECLMANEFTGIDLQCEPPYLVPLGRNVQPQHQSCTLAGSRPGQSFVEGANYIQESFSYSRTHLWRNFGFLWAFFFFFVALTMFGMERMKPNAGGAAVTVFKRGQVPKSIEKTIETAGREKKDEEAGLTSHIAEKTVSDSGESSEKDKNKAVANVAKNEIVFTFQNINYTIPYEKGTRQLLNDVQGYVRPGKLTALMGASGKC